MAKVRVEAVSKSYDGRTPAVRDVSFEIADGEFLVLLGPSGCGKSTLLRMVAGLEEVTGGSIRLGERDVTFLPPAQRDVAMVFQSYALYPHMTVYDNLAFPLRMRKVPKTERDAKVREAARWLGLEELLDRKPGQLSGGQKQRVALGRAMVREPALFLLDEPLSNLDALLRVEARQELRSLHQARKATILYVTHDQVEALTLGNRIAIMNRGELQQIGPPLEVYQQPANTFVATFLGSPGMNLLPWPCSGETDTAEGWRIHSGEVSPAVATIGVRPERLSAGRTEPSGAAVVLQGRIDQVEPLGADLLLYVRSRDKQVIARVPVDERFEPGETVFLSSAAENLRGFDAAGNAQPVFGGGIGGRETVVS